MAGASPWRSPIRRPRARVAVAPVAVAPAAGVRAAVEAATAATLTGPPSRCAGRNLGGGPTAPPHTSPRKFGPAAQAPPRTLAAPPPKSHGNPMLCLGPA